MSMNLKEKAVGGIIWSFADNLFRLGISFVIGIVLARLLTPEAYGLIGVISIFTSLFITITDSGLSTALIKKENATDKDFSTIFIANIVVSLFLYLLLYLSAPFIADFFGNSQLVSLTRVAGIIVIINGLSLIQKTHLTKLVDFKTQTKVTLLASIIGGAVGISMALLGFGVWSLVAQLIISSLVTTVSLWLFNRWWPKMVFSYNSFKELFGFGWKLMLVGIISTFWKDIYNLVIGKCYQPAVLGQYTRSKQFADLCSSNITSVVQRVSLPILSRVQSDQRQMLNVYRKTLRLTAFVSFVLLCGLAGISQTFIYVLLGEQWLTAAKFLPIICMIMMLYSIGLINLNMIAIKGRSDLCLKIEVVKKIIDILPIVMGIVYDIYWMLYASVVTSVVSYFINAYYSKVLIGYSIPEQLKDVLPSLAIALSMGIILFVMSSCSINVYLLLIIQILFAIMYVIVVCKVTKNQEFYEIINIVKRLLGKYIHR